MKKNARGNVSYRIIPVFLIILLFSGCDFLLGPDKTGANGNLTISLPGNGSSRVVGDEEAASYRYIFTFTGPGGQSFTRETAPGGGSFSLSLALGEWTIEAEAYLVDIPAGRGKKTLTILPGQNFAEIPMDETFLFALDRDDPHTFEPLNAGYTVEDVTPLEITVSNLGVHDIDSLSVTLSNANFTVEGILQNIAEDGWNIFTVKPSPNLGPGTYRATVTVSGGGSSESFDVSVTVRSKFSTIDEINIYLAEADGGSTADAPVPLPVQLNLASDWATLLTTIRDNGKYVALDLSESTPAAPEFDPGTANTGEKYIVSLVLPDGATSIKAGTSNSAFQYFTKLTEVSGTDIQTIGAYAFSTRAGLSSVSFPKATSIGKRAFNGCTSLSSVTFLLATSIGEGAFDVCTSLASVNIPLATSISSYAFNGCTSLSSASFLLATSIGDQAFRGCILSSATFPLVVTIGDTVFENCTSLSSATFLAATSIGTYAFKGCTSLSLVTFPEAETIGKEAFFNCIALATASFPNATSIGEGAFNVCKNLTTASFPEATSIGSQAFNGCFNLVSVNIPLATGIGNNAFSSCTSLASANFPVATSIGSQAFNGCAGLTTVNFPVAETIGANAFNACTKLTSVTFPEATSIGNSAFSSCQILASASFPAAISIGENAFEYCTSLATASFPEVLTIGNYAFANTGSISLTITLGSTLPALGNNIFQGLAVPKTVTIQVPSAVVDDYTSDTIWQDTFKGSSNITLIVSAVYEIGDTGPAGGIIFYVNTDHTYGDWTYLEAAPADIDGTTIHWASLSFMTISIPGTSTAIGSGRANTAAILAVDTDAPAAKACANYSDGGFDDWFLPSRDELNAMYAKKNAINGFNDSYSWYWSSSEYSFGDGSYAWIQNFSTGVQEYYATKTTDGNVRAVRAF